MPKMKEQMDFYKNKHEPAKGKNKENVYPEYLVCESKDLVIRGGRFYVVYDEQTGKWTDKKVVIQKVIDADIDKRIAELNADQENVRDKIE